MSCLFQNNEIKNLLQIMRDKKNIIKAGYLLSYDYSYIFTSIKQIYNHVDRIVISYDENNKTWVGNDVYIPESFFSEIKSIDKQNKIIFYKDKFFIPDTPPMDLETRQRNMMAEKMGQGGWHIQIDGDEYAYDFKRISQFLRKNKYLLAHPERNPINFQVDLVTLFRHDENGFYIIEPFEEKCLFITNFPKYKYARRLNTGRTLPLPYLLIHQSWARDENEILEKIMNWGHKNDFDTMKFFEFWKSINSENYTNFIDFHPLTATDWHKLSFFPAKNIEEFIVAFEKKFPQQELKLNLSSTKKIKLWIKSLF